MSDKKQPSEETEESNAVIEPVSEQQNTGTPESSEYRGALEPQSRDDANPEKTTKHGSPMVVLSMLVALVAASGTAYLYYQQYQASQQESPVFAQQSDLDRVVRQIQEKTEQWDLLSSSIKKQREVQYGAIAEIDQKLALQASRIDVADDAIEKLNRVTGQHLKGWAIDEVAYLLRIADNALQLNGDVEVAQAALQRAEQRVRAQANAQWVPLGQEIATLREQLDALNLPIPGAVYKDLSDAITMVPQLPITSPRSTAEFTDSPAQEAPASETTDWKASLQHAWDEFVSGLSVLVRITPVTSDQLPFVTPDQQQQLYLNMVVQLQNAQTALLMRDQASYLQALQMAQQWINTYADDQDATVVRVNALLSNAKVYQVTPELPSVTPLLAKVALLQQSGAPTPGSATEDK